MIIFVTQFRHRYTHSHLINAIDDVEVIYVTYQWLINQNELPKGTYIFTDRERMDLWELRVYAALFNHLNDSGPGYKAINNPSAMMNRRSLLRALYANNINDFNAYSATELESPKQFPVFLRREYDHKGNLSDLLNSQDDLDREIKIFSAAGEPQDGLLITEYCAQPIAEGIFRKLSSYRVGANTFFYNVVIESEWGVKYGTPNLTAPEQFEEELQMIKDNAFDDIISRAFEVANIDYGRIDFVLLNGKPQIYEINTNPQTKPPQPHHNTVREDSQNLAWRNYCKSLKAIDTTDCNAEPAQYFEHADLFVHPNARRSIVR